MPDPSPTGENRTVPRRGRNRDRRPREYLTGGEVERLMATARRRPGRHGHRDATMILTTFLGSLARECEILP